MIWNKLIVFILLVILSCSFVYLVFFVGLCIVLLYLFLFKYLFHRFCWWSTQRSLLASFFWFYRWIILFILSSILLFTSFFYIVIMSFIICWSLFKKILNFIFSFFEGFLFSQRRKWRVFRLILFWSWLSISRCFYDWNWEHWNFDYWLLIRSLVKVFSFHVDMSLFREYNDIIFLQLTLFFSVKLFFLY